MTCEGEEELGRAVLHSHRRKLFERVRPGCVHVHVACHVMLEMSCPCHLCEMGMGICMLHVHSRLLAEAALDLLGEARPAPERLLLEPS